MYWQMFRADEADEKPFRLHLLSEVGDPGPGPGTSLGFVEPTLARGFLSSRKGNIKFTVRINSTRQTIDVPDLETGMAVLMMNVKGDSDV